jgi:hypothetical protein
VGEKRRCTPDIWVTPAVEDYDLPTFGANNGANLYPQEDGSFLATGMIENKTHYIMMLNTRLKGITGIRVEAMTDEMLPKLGRAGRRTEILCCQNCASNPRRCRT